MCHGQVIDYEILQLERKLKNHDFRKKLILVCTVSPIKKGVCKNILDRNQIKRVAFDKYTKSGNDAISKVDDYGKCVYRFAWRVRKRV
jgi:hypothetical protein